MLVLRFMSADEAIRLLDGQTIRRDTDHAAAGNRTNSVGSCFVIVKAHEATGMYDSARRLSGIAIMDVCLVGKLPDPLPKNFKETSGRYKVDDNILGAKVAMIPELSTTEYALDDFTDWRMYTPELPPREQMFKMISSVNWIDPVLTRSKP